MPENIIPQSPGGKLRPGQRLRLTSLAPKFDVDRHMLYYDMLRRAINSGGTRNVALTGAYGTGKSSVLEQLGQDQKDRVVELSLSTIAPEIHDTDDSHTSSARKAAGSRTNQIQKEIVKQLLYRLPPSSVPRSRFHRASVPNKVHDWRLAAVIGGGTFLVLFGLGLLQPFVEDLLPMLWRQITAYVLLFTLMICSAWIVIKVVRSRPMMSASVPTGATTITLSKQSDTYFDEYLDEIAYFFQVSQRDIVIIEDIDRFEDVQVFDTLRALNGLLNTSEQVGRRIVFIYAIRDSVFEHIGVNVDHSSDVAIQCTPKPDHAKQALIRASRTKFFDVIIPIVPFVSADNARDVMSEALKSKDFNISPALIRLAARHIADMRMIHNIRNEFEVYRSRLVVPEARIPGISDDLVFTIVLFKNTHLADFEKIRHRDSTLDKLYVAWRALVQENLKEHTQRLKSHRRALRLDATKAARAARLGRNLVDFRDLLQAAANVENTGTSVELSGPATADNAEAPGTWSKIASENSQQVTLKNPNSSRSPTINLSFSSEQLGSLLGITFDSKDWETADQQDIDIDIAKEDSQIDFLRHHTWKDLCARSDFLVDASPFGFKDTSGELIKKQISFDDIVTAGLESELARDLVRHGFLTSHFALYSSSYYGEHLGHEAMEFIHRCIEPGTPDASFAMSEDEVIQVLLDQEADQSDTSDLFQDLSVFNLSILDYLLEKRPGAAATVARRLSRLGEQEQEFIDTYVVQGKHPGALLAEMSLHWSEVLQYAAVEAPVESVTRPALLDAVFRVLPNHHFDVNREVGRILEASYSNMEAISNPASAKRANIVLQVVRASGAILEFLDPLNDIARTTAVELRLFPITVANLRLLVPKGVIALDVLRAHESLYTYVLDQLDRYLELVDTARHGFQTVADPQMFSTVLTEAAERSSATLLGRLVNKSGDNFRVDDLRSVAAEAWPFLAAKFRTSPTFSNTSAYLDLFGIDKSLGALLNKHKKITDAEEVPEDERRKAAITVLAAREEIPSTNSRVRIAASIKPGLIEATSLVPEQGDLVAKLLKRKLVADDVSVFSANLMIDWLTLETTIAASKKFATFVSADVLDGSIIPSFLHSAKIPKATIQVVVSNITEYIAKGNNRQSRAIAAALVSTGWRMPYESLEALRAGGATDAQVIALIVARGDELQTSQLKILLEALGGDYARIATGGRGRPTFKVCSDNDYILGRLSGDTIKKVELEVFKSKGRKLVAQLRIVEEM